MAEPFMCEIRVFSFNFAPKGWAMCNGQLLPINQNQAMFALIGTTYGGNGQTNFALPNLRGRVPMGAPGGSPGQQGGEEFHTLSRAELPVHGHQMAVSQSPALERSPKQGTARMLPAVARDDVYGLPSGSAQVIAQGTGGATTTTGGSQPHENRQPFLTLNFCIALQGIFPSQY